MESGHDGVVPGQVRGADQENRRGGTGQGRLLTGAATDRGGYRIENNFRVVWAAGSWAVSTRPVITVDQDRSIAKKWE